MKSLIMGAALAAAATFGLAGCDDEGARSELQQEQRELEAAKQRDYDSAAERRQEIEGEKQDVRETARDRQEEREGAYGGAGNQAEEQNDSLDATDINTQEWPQNER